MGLVCGDLRWFVVGVVCFSADVCGGVPALWVCGAVSCLAFVVACRFLLGVCGGMPFLAWRVLWRAVSRLACVVASRAVLTWRAGEGGGLILPALAKSAPTLPSPPRHPGTARCAACGCAGRNAVTPHSGAGAHGIARSRGEPSSARCEQRLSERLTPCPCDPVCACTGMRGHAFLSPTPHAAQRAVPGWRGGLGRVGADLASAGSMRPPPSPARTVSTAWLATKHVSRETARHHKRQPRNRTPPHKPAKKRHAPAAHGPTRFSPKPAPAIGRPPPHHPTRAAPPKPQRRRWPGSQPATSSHRADAGPRQPTPWPGRAAHCQN